MPGISENCSICSKSFEVQFRYQMEEKEGVYSFYCSHACHKQGLSANDGVVCDVCAKRFVVEYVAQVVRDAKQVRKFACSEECRAHLSTETNESRTVSFRSAHEVSVSTNEKKIASPNTMTSGLSLDVNKASSQDGLTEKEKLIFGPKRLAVFNHKGGTGKTTTTVNVAAGLASLGLKVLLIDTDSQGNVGVSLGVNSERSLYHVLVMGINPKEVVQKIRPNLDFIASNETLAAAELYLAGRPNRDRVLRERLGKVEKDYDIVVLDCSPSLSLMNQNSLVFAEGVLVPVACDFLSLVGVRQVLKTIKNVNSLLHHPVHIFGVLPTFFDARARICRDAVDTLKQHFGQKCLEPIRSTTKIKEAPAQGKTIFEYAPDSNAAEDYMNIVEYIKTGSLKKRSLPEQENEAQIKTGSAVA